MTAFSGEFFDGRSTTPMAVVLTLTAKGLAVSGPDGISHSILYADIRNLEKAGDGFRCSIAAKAADSDAPSGVLHFSQEELYRELLSRIIATRSSLQRAFAAIGSFKVWQVFLIVIAALALFIALLYTAVLQAYRITPVSYDSYLGRRVDSTWSGIYESCNALPIDSFLDKGMKRLSLPTDRFPHRVIVLNDSMENAFALPGGTIYLFRGLLEKSPTPDAVLGVLSHEIAHAECRHTVRQIIQNMSVGYLTTLIVGMAIDGFDQLEGLESTLEMSSVLFMLRYSRTFEREADSLAIFRMHAAGLRVGSLDSLLTRLSPKPRKRDRLFAWLSTHPLNEERSRRFQAARAQETFAQDTVFAFERKNWEKIRKGCLPLKDTRPLWKKVVRRRR
jgi:Zn-dependent protease with chaperone function